jgi:predicted transposase/invertase (TIGR01784 family)
MTDENIDDYRLAHDRLVKFAFSDMKNSQDLFENFLPPAVLARLDLSTLKLVPGSFVDTELKERLTDLLFSVTFRSGEKGLVYILFDHKSHPDSLMPFKMLRYMVKVWDRQLQNQTQLMPIIPLILYHGANEWKTARTMSDVLKAPDDLKYYVPQFNTVLIDLSQRSDQELRGNALYNAVLQLLKYIGRDDLPERLPGLLKLFVQILDEPNGMDCLKAVLVYLANATDKFSREELSDALHHAFVTVKTAQKESQSPMPTIAEQWRQEGREEGLEKGLEKGLEIGIRTGIRVVLDIRFADHTAAIMDHIADIHANETLTEFLELCRTAANVDQLRDFLDANK